MRKVPLGTTDLNVSKICLGTMTFGEQNTEAEGHRQLDLAIEQGINFIDTAELYAVPARKETQGKTEAIIGSWLKQRGDRDQLVIATKMAGALPFTAHIRPPKDFTKDYLDEALHDSLQRLQTDYVDLYQLHWPTRRTNFFGRRGYVHDPRDPWQDNFLEVLQHLDALIKSGKIRHWGVSNETPWGLMRFLHLADVHGFPRPVSIQNPYSLLNRTFEIGLSEICLRENIAVLPYSPLAFGLLSGKFHRGQDRPENRMHRFKKQLARYQGKHIFEVTGKYVEIADEFGLNMAQMSLAFVNDRPFVTSNIIGATSLDQLRENIGSDDLRLTKPVIKAINAVHERYPNPAP